jgi:predicted nucleic acid-binding protein
MTAFLLDTNVISELVRPAPKPSVTRFLNEAGDLWLSVVTLHEFAYGLARVTEARRRLKLEAFIASMKNQFDGRILDVDAGVSEMAGNLRAYATSQGRILDPLDALIAATAVNHGLTLVTRNVKDFDCLELTPLNPWDE